MIYTKIYERRFAGKEEPSKGLGVTWEGAIIIQELYDAQGGNTKFVPVVLAAGDADYVPIILRGPTRHDLSSEDGYDKLYRRLTG